MESLEKKIMNDFVLINRNEIIRIVEKKISERIKRIDVIVTFYSNHRGYGQRKTIFVSPRLGTIEKLMMLFSKSSRKVALQEKIGNKPISIVVYL